MACTVFTIANQKGGVGKTTTAVNLAAALAEQEIRTLLVDLDPQANATSALGVDKQEGKSLYGPLRGEGSAFEMLTPTEWPHLALIPSEVDLAAIEIELAQQENYLMRLRSVLEPQAAELAAERGSEEQRAALAAVIAAMHAELARTTPDRRALIALDRDLHRQIWAMAGNEMLEQTLEWLFSHVLRRWNVSIDRNESLGSVMQMHDEIADAIVAGDAQQARAAMARHVAGFQASQTS